MKKFNNVIKGTLILTTAGILSKILGFFYRIYLSRCIGAAGMGLFQIVMPAAGIVFAICSSGIQTAISKFCCDKKNDFLWLISGLLLSIPTSLILTFIVYTNADFIATRFILNEACSSLLKILSLSFPFAAFHNCINGFYFAKKKTAIPAFSQLFEQIIRFCAVYIYVTIYASDGNASVLCAIYSNLFGEIASFLYCTCAIFYTFIKSKYNNTHKKSSLMSKIREIFKFSFPLTANRLLMHIFQSAEAVLVPAQLIVYGLSKSDSVSIYGILTGMAMPLILFPTALTNSLAVMLLPAVSELNLENNNKSIKSTINKCITFCISTGVLSTAIFIFYGSYAGAIVFNQPEVRNYVCILAWLCPFIYLTVTMGSILNGLGETTATCIQNISGIIVRLIFLVILVPKYGITMYMAGLLCSQILVCICHYIKLSRMLHIRMNAHGWFLIPGFFSLLSTGISLIFYKYISRLVSGLIPLFGGAVTACIIYIFLYATFYPYRNKPH